jgi:cell division protein FtsW
MSVRRGFDTVLALSVLVLLVLGLIMVQSASAPVAADRYGDAWFYVKRQTMGMGLGVAGLVAVALMPYHQLRKHAWVFYGAVVLGLILVFIPGIGRSVNGAARWINAGSMNLQPSEFAKVAVVVCMAHLLDQNKGRLHEPKVLGKVLTVPAIVMALIYFEPDLGTTVIVAGVAGITLYLAGLRTRYVLGGLISAPLVLLVAILLEPYRIRRIEAFIDPYADASGSGYQVIQSMLAFHSGGFMGRGLGESQAKHLFLPEPWTDFVASVLAEELGLVGVLALIGVYCVIVWRGMAIARNAPDLFGTLLASSLTAMIGLQAFFNLGVVMGMVPNKGLVLPFVSYGVSAVMGHLLCVGLLLNVSANRAPVRTPAIYRAAATAEAVV